VAMEACCGGPSPRPRVARPGPRSAADVAGVRPALRQGVSGARCAQTDDAYSPF
jgi:hypothetical protein